jgi:uncharacterized protein (TIGR04255 family)
MGQQFTNAPLRELVAELQWATQIEAMSAPGPFNVPVNLSFGVGNNPDDFLDRFAVAMDDLGFRNQERLVPNDAPSPIRAPILRFRPRAGQTPLVQIGHGLFSINGMPPVYKNWGDFREYLANGVAALLETRNSAEKNQQFASVAVRYINAFTEDYWGGRTAADFMADVLNFRPNIPQEISALRDDSTPMIINQNARMPLSAGGALSIGVGNGVADGEDAVLLELAVTYENVAAHALTLLEQFDDAHGIINQMFRSVTADIIDTLKPVDM